MQTGLLKSVSWYLVIAMFVLGITPRVDAGLSPSEALKLAQFEFDRPADLQKVQKALEMKMVRERLSKLGFTQDEIQQKLGLMSSAQLHQLAVNLDDAMQGGDGALGVIVALLVIAILFVILVQLMGRRVVITKN